MLVVVGNAPAGNDGAQVELAAQLLAGIVQATPEAHAPVGRFDEHIHPVEYVAVGVMGREGTVVGDLGIGMFIAESLVIHDHGQRHRHHFAVIFDAQLSLGKAGDLLPIFIPGQMEQPPQPTVHLLPDIPDIDAACATLPEACCLVYRSWGIS